MSKKRDFGRSWPQQHLKTTSTNVTHRRSVKRVGQHWAYSSASAGRSTFTFRVKVLRPQPSSSAASPCARGMLQGGFDQDSLEIRHRLLEQMRVARRQRPIRPFAERVAPVSAGRFGPLELAQFRRQIIDQHFPTRGHDGQPATGVFQLPHIARPREMREMRLGVAGQDLGFRGELLGGLGEKMLGQPGMSSRRSDNRGR